MNTFSRKGLFAVISAAALLFAVLRLFAFSSDADENGVVSNVPSYLETGVTVKNLLSGTEDYEEYLFTVSSYGTIQLKLGHYILSTGEANEGWSVSVYQVFNPDGIAGSDMRELSYGKYLLKSENVMSENIGVYPGTYLVRVSSLEKCPIFQYMLTVNFTEEGGWEDEYNDDAAHYTKLSLNTPVKGVTSDRSVGLDNDYYLFTIPESGCVDITFSHENLVDSSQSNSMMVLWSITLKGLDGNSFCKMNSKAADVTLSSGKLGLKPGSYIIAVEPVYETFAEYTLSAGFTAGGSYESEFNDSAEYANVLLQGQRISGSLSQRFLSLDKDYYKIVMDSDGLLNLSFGHIFYEGDKDGWNIKLLDENLNVICAKISSFNQTETVISDFGLSAGTYYICIDSEYLAANNGEYSLLYGFKANDFTETERNDTLETADTIKENIYYEGALISQGVDFDVDYYCITLTQPQKLLAYFSHDKVTPYDSITGLRKGWIITVCDESGKALTTVNSAWNAVSTQTEALLLQPGKYYIKVETGLYGSENPYKLMAYFIK